MVGKALGWAHRGKSVFNGNLVRGKPKHYEGVEYYPNNAKNSRGILTRIILIIQTHLEGGNSIR